MNLAATVITLLVLELCGLVMSISGESAAATGTYMFWIGALVVTAVAITTLILLL